MLKQIYKGVRSRFLTDFAIVPCLIPSLVQTTFYAMVLNVESRPVCIKAVAVGRKIVDENPYLPASLNFSIVAALLGLYLVADGVRVSTAITLAKTRILLSHLI